MAIDARQLGGTTIRKIAVITSSQNWVAPAGLVGGKVWLTGCAAGGSGAYLSVTSGFATGGFGGAYCERIPVSVTAGATYAVVIPAGGVGVASGGGNAGGDLTFGSLLTLKGGRGGASQTGTAASLNQFFDFTSAVGVRPNIFISSTAAGLGVAAIPADTVGGNVCGSAVSSGVDNYRATGGACGLFGNGANSSTSTTAPSALANSGAGGGAVVNVLGTSGAGGSGKLIIEWDEFL